MNEKENREYQTVILGALLHDVGKFYQRGLDKGRGDHQRLGDECFEEYFAEGLSRLLSQDEIGIIRSAINNHHGHSEFVTHADGISAGMERIERIKLEDEEYGDPTKERLQSVFEKISLGNNDKKTNEYTYPLKSLSLKRDELFPTKIPEQSLKEEYKGLWEGFTSEIKNIPTSNLRSYLNTLYTLLQKYSWCIPSAAYKHEPDISLFDHLKTTAAIAGCLYHNKRSDNKREKEFLLVAGDISGIQNFIYRIAKAQGMGGISKRLRGRSFYLLLLQEVIAKYIIEQAGLFTTNILFCGGGRFELLLPNTETTLTILTDATRDINKWLFEEYGGEIGIVIKWIEVNGNGLGDYSGLLEQIDEKLSAAKKKKFNTLFEDPSFWCEKEEANIRICKVCSIGKVKVEDDKKLCKWCEQHKEIGERLPKIEYLIFASSKEDRLGNKPVQFGNFGTVYMLSEEISGNEGWLKSDKVLDIQKINDLDGLMTGFRFIGNTAPIATDGFSIDNLEDEDKKVKKDDVLSFEIIADASIGDKRIGILKMDVDYLGLIFAIGLEEKENSRRKSISRITLLSRSMDMFFAGYLNRICEDVFEEWKNDKNNKWEHKNKVDQIFYIVYSGGDDLLIVGPWSEIPKLAKKINDEFRKYTCNNPDINISAGIFLCKPKYPISFAAKGAGEQLETSKEKRKRITLFDDTAEWVSGNDNLGMDELLSFGEQLYSCVSNKDLPRGFVHGLLRKHKQYDGGQNPNFIPAVIYQLVRNIKDDKLRSELKGKLIGDKRLFFKHIKIPASYALLKSRKEG